MTSVYMKDRSGNRKKLAELYGARCRIGTPRINKAIARGLLLTLYNLETILVFHMDSTGPTLFLVGLFLQKSANAGYAITHASGVDNRDIWHGIVKRAHRQPWLDQQ